MPGESYRRRLGSFLLCFYDVLVIVQKGLLYHGEISDGCCCVPSHHVTSRNATGDVAICAGGAALPRGDQ